MEHEFKVGDRIEQIRWLKTGQNKFAIVTKVEGNGIYHKHDGEGDKDIGWIMSEDIKLAEPESKFKVGDRVRIINDTRGNNTNLKNGAILTVKEIVDESLIFEDNYWIGFEEDKDRIIESSLELIKPEYKVGDRVRITKDSSSYVGSVGVLKMIDDSPSRYPYWVQLENNTTWVEDIELVGQPEYKDMLFYYDKDEYDCFELVKTIWEREHGYLIGVDDVVKQLSTVKTNEVKEMELKNIKKENLKEAKKQYNEEKANAEIKFAKRELACAHDDINMIDSKIKDLQEIKKPLLEIVKKFGGK